MKGVLLTGAVCLSTTPLMAEDETREEKWYQYEHLVGHIWALPGDWKNFQFKLIAGVIHGYKEPWDDKIPFNSSSGWAPGLVPSFGYKKGRLGADVMLLGNSGLLFTVGTDF